jgi:hypothetical protein
MKSSWAWLLAAAALGTAEAAKAAEPRPLFADDSVIQLEIRGAVSSARRAGTSTAATLTLKGATPETHEIRLSPRGITRLRRETCTFPPLRVEFAAKPAQGSLFRGQRRLKLVTHCREPVAFQRHVLLEYAAYRLYNLVTPASFRVRLARIEYVGETGRPLTSRMGFFIEDVDDVAWRNGGKEAEVGDGIAAAQLSAQDAAAFAVFQYMIGNLDWSMTRGPQGRGCCHNSRLITAGGVNGRYAPVPYDFDYSGLVDAPYAVPPNSMQELANVRVRRYRGYCAHHEQALAAVAQLRAKRTQFQSTLASVEGLDPTARRKAAAYLDSFFDDMADTERAAERLRRTCVG